MTLTLERDSDQEIILFLSLIIPDPERVKHIIVVIIL